MIAVKIEPLNGCFMITCHAILRSFIFFVSSNSIKVACQKQSNLGMCEKELVNQVQGRT